MTSWWKKWIREKLRELQLSEKDIIATHPSIEKLKTEFNEDDAVDFNYYGDAPDSILVWTDKFVIGNDEKGNLIVFPRNPC